MQGYGKALIFAAKKHAGQKRKGGADYIGHPIRVSQQVQSEKQKIIALLHDLLEDTNTTFTELEKEFGEDIAEAVVLLTHLKDESYEEYIRLLKLDPDAVAVKIADICDNLSGMPSPKAIERYATALTALCTTA